MWRTLLSIAVVIGDGLIAWLGTGALIPLLRRHAVLDRPNERSLHDIPTPRGGGIAVIGAIMLAWVALSASGQLPYPARPILLGVLLLAAVSWADDVRGLPPMVRLAVQLVAIGLVLRAGLLPGLVFQGWLSPALDGIATAVVWLWFVNLFNFMDGIDGLAGVEAAAIGVGLLLFAAVGSEMDPGLAAAPAAIAAAALGFLVWNWAPARIFLGDVGSVPLGYLLGFLLLDQAARGHWEIALILPLYFLADATITLLRRLLRGERVWEAHRSHFYQRAVQRGFGHAAVVQRVVVANIVLIGCGWAAANGWPILGLAAAGITVIVLLGWMAAAPARR
ncbi:MAG: glycosyltransferase family 4 protein [Alphaproteobacteria bacterium]|nr:glycosyltransferase family 4 protein [Alphaproteobacteria bacterium]